MIVWEQGFNQNNIKLRDELDFELIFGHLMTDFIAIYN